MSNNQSAPPGFYFIICPDAALGRLELQKLARAWLPGQPWKTCTYWGDEEPPESLWENLKQAGLFTQNKILVVRHAELWSAAVWKDLSQTLAHPIEQTLPFFCLESAWEKGRPKLPAHIQKSRCYLFAVKNNWLWQNQGLTSQTLKDFIKTQAAIRKLIFRPEDLASFSASAATDAQTILNELDKLALMAKDGRIESAMLSSFMNTLESNAFNLIRKIMAGDMNGAWRELEMADDSLLFLLIALFAREFRTLWSIAQGQSPYLHPQDAAQKKRLARTLGAAGISQGFAALANAEFQVKSGKQTPAQTLEALAIDLGRLFACA